MGIGPKDTSVLVHLRTMSGLATLCRSHTLAPFNFVDMIPFLSCFGSRAARQHELSRHMHLQHYYFTPPAGLTLATLAHVVRGCGITVWCLMTVRLDLQPPEHTAFTPILMVLSCKALLEQLYFVILRVSRGSSRSFSNLVSSCCSMANVTLPLLLPRDDKNGPCPGSCAIAGSVLTTLPRLCGRVLMECSDDFLVHTLWIGNAMCGVSHPFQR